MKRRIACGIEYNGARYHGWQRQVDLDTVQGHVERAISKVANEKIKVMCCGRTDTGVHAVGQVIHFETQAKRSARSWVFGGNTELPADINIRWAKEVPDTFHARHSAKGRYYRYFIYNSPTRSGVLANSMTWHYQKLDEAVMREAASCLIGKHDFSSYRAIGCQAKSPVRDLRDIRISRQHDTLILDFYADGFLHHMVRNIVGVLMAIGQGKAKVDWAKEVLEAKDRRLGGVTAPPYGLYFVKADYPDEFAIPQSEAPLLVL